MDEIKRLKGIIKKKNEKIRQLNKRIVIYKEDEMNADRRYYKVRNQYLAIANMLPRKYFMVTFKAMTKAGGMGTFSKLKLGYLGLEVVETLQRECECFELIDIEERG